MTDTVTRHTHLFTVYGTDVDGNDTGSYITMERTDKLIVQRSAGRDYQKTIWEFYWPYTTIIDDHTRIDDDSDGANMHRKRIKKRIRQPDGPAWVDVWVLESIWSERGSGRDYQKTKRTWANTKQATGKRMVVVDQLFGKDGKSYLYIEKIMQYDHERGAGRDYQYTKWLPLWPFTRAENQPDPTQQ
jgi:hypothetical protein